MSIITTVPDGYSLVWSDEFDGNRLDASKWDFEARMRGTGKIELSEGDDTVFLNDGKLCLLAQNFRNPNRESTRYKVPCSVVTKYKMNYTYGYVEIKARVPFFEGSWPSFWALSAGGNNAERCPSYNLELEVNREYDVEIDVFEVFGSDREVVPNIHKWYRTNKFDYCKFAGIEGKNHTMLGKQKWWDWSKHISNLENLNNEYHLYGFLWTPNEMSFYVDGEKYFKIDITKSYDKYPDMSGFHKPIYLIFNNHVFADDLLWYGNLVSDHNTLPFGYYIDYIRLYQKPDEGELYIAE